MPTVKLSPILNDVQFLTTGVINSGGKIYTYSAGSSTPQTTYTDSTGATPQANPIILNAYGQVSNPIWLTSGLTYKFIVQDSTGVQVGPTYDNIAGINDTSVTVSQWVASSLTPTYISGTSFSFAGDQTSIYTIGRRLQFTVTSGTVYGRILTSAFGVITTITMVMDGASVLDSGLSAVSYGILTNNVSSVPQRIATATGTDTYVAALGLTALVIGDEYEILFTNTNTLTTSTLNLDSLGAKTLKWQSGAAIAVGSVSGQHTIRWDGTNMIVLNPFLNILDTDFSGSVTDGSGAGLAFTTVVGKITRTNARAFVTLVLTYPVTANGANSQVNGLTYAVNGEVPLSCASNRAGGVEALAGAVAAGAVSFYAPGTLTRLTNAQMSGVKVYVSGHYAI